MKALIQPIFCLLFLCPWILGNAGMAGCPNTFAESANKTSPEALLFSAKQKLDTQSWDDAITIMASMKTEDRNKREARVIEASAFAGKCGLKLIDLANAIANQIATKTLMVLVLEQMKDATSYADCATAESTLQGILTSEMTADDYVFLTFIEFAKMGAVLQVAGADVNNDGTVDGGFATCSAISAAQTDELAKSFNIALSSISASGVAIGSTVTAQMTSICTQGYPCSKTSGFTPTEQRAVRTLIHTSELGFNTCPGLYTDIACICP